MLAIGMGSLRCQSLHATGGNARTVARSLLSALDKAAPPSLLLWLADSAQPDHIAAELAAAAPVVVGGVSHAGLIGGGTRCPEYEGEGQAERAVALAVTLPAGATATAWHSLPTGLPDLPAATWEAFATARPADSPHLLLIAAPPLDAAFPIESFLATLDRLLPWANKVGGLLAGSSSLYVGGERHDGGVAGVALQGVALDAVVCQGATPVGPSFTITEAQGISVLELDGQPVGQHQALDELLRAESVAGGTLMAGLSVPCGPTAAAGVAGVAGVAGAAAAARVAHAPQYLIRPIVGYSRGGEGGALQLGAPCWQQPRLTTRVCARLPTFVRPGANPYPNQARHRRCSSIQARGCSCTATRPLPQEMNCAPAPPPTPPPPPPQAAPLPPEACTCRAWGGAAVYTVMWAPRVASWPRRSAHSRRVGWPAGSRAARSGPSGSAPSYTRTRLPSHSCEIFSTAPGGALRQ